MTIGGAAERLSVLGSRLGRLPVPRAGLHPALWAVALFWFGPLSFILQVAYAESLFLVLVFASLWMMLSKRYLLMIPFAVMAAFTRPGVLVLSLALAIMLVLHWRERDRFAWSERWAIVAAGLIIAASGFGCGCRGDHAALVHWLPLSRDFQSPSREF